MKQKIKLLLKYLPSLGLLAFPALAKAQSAVQNGLQTSGLQGLFGLGGNTLSGSTNLEQFITTAIQLMLLFAGAIAIVFVIIGGYYYITAAGNEEQSEKGRKTLTNAIIGIIIIVLSYAIITVISNLVSSTNGNGF